MEKLSYMVKLREDARKQARFFLVDFSVQERMAWYGTQSAG